MTAVTSDLLAATCSRLSQRAASGETEIKSLLPQGEEIRDEPAHSLFLLSAQLNKFRQLAARLGDALRDASNISAELHAAMSDVLSDCDSATAVITKQLTRLGGEISRDRINASALQQYRSFMLLTTQCFTLLTQLLSL
jgi:hypothetical protein